MIKLNRVQKKEIIDSFFDNHFEIEDIFGTEDIKYIVSQNIYLDINGNIEQFIDRQNEVKLYFRDTRNYICNLLIHRLHQKIILKSILLEDF